MIKKENLIFSNLYGFDDPFLKGALKRGDWKDIKRVLKKSPQEIINEVKNSGLRGRRWCRFFYWYEMGFYAKI